MQRAALFLFTVTTLNAAAAPATPAAPAADAPADPQAPLERIRAVYEQIRAIMHTDAPLDALRKRVEALTDTFVDYRELARLTVKEQWPTWDEARRKTFVDLFKRLIRRTYARKFKRDPHLTVVFEGGAELRKGRARVRTTVTSGGTSVEVEYRLYLPAGQTQWWVYDIVIDGVSLRRNYRSQFQRILRKEGAEGLLRRLREKVEAAPQ